MRVLAGIPIRPSLIFGPFRKIVIIQFHSTCIYEYNIAASRLGKGLIYRCSGGNSIKAIPTDDDHGSHFVILGILRQQLTKNQLKRVRSRNPDVETFFQRTRQTQHLFALPIFQQVFRLCCVKVLLFKFLDFLQITTTGRHRGLVNALAVYLVYEQNLIGVNKFIGNGYPLATFQRINTLKSKTKIFFRGKKLGRIVELFRQGLEHKYRFQDSLLVCKQFPGLVGIDLQNRPDLGIKITLPGFAGSSQRFAGLIEVFPKQIHPQYIGIFR